MGKPEKIELDLEKVLIKRYRVRRTGRNGVSLETTIPHVVFEREARCLGLTVREALEKLDAVWRYDSFEGLHLTFEPKETQP